MAVNLTNMEIAFNGNPFIELPAGSLDLLNMDIAFNGNPFVRQSGLIPPTVSHILFLSGSVVGSKLLLLGTGYKKLKLG